MKNMQLFDKDGKEYNFITHGHHDNSVSGNLFEIIPEPEKGQCSKIGSWCLNAENRPVTNFTFPSVGNVYPNKEKTQEAGARRTELEIINQCIMYWQEKLNPDWVVAYSNITQAKCTIMGYDYARKEWRGAQYHATETPYLVCSQKVMNKVLELLNKGLVEGVNK